METIIGFIAIVAAAFIIQGSLRRNIVKKEGLPDGVSIGKLLQDLPGHGSSFGDVTCCFGYDSLVIISSTGILGQIPLKSIENIEMFDKSTYSSRLTVTRMAVFGIFSLAMPKQTKKNEYIISISWNDEFDVHHDTAFIFSHQLARMEATRVLDELKTYQALYSSRGTNKIIQTLIGKSSKALFSHIEHRLKDAAELVGKQQFNDADSIYTSIITYNPRHSLALRNRGICRHVLGKKDAAWDDMMTAASLGDKDAKDYIEGKYAEV